MSSKLKLHAVWAIGPEVRPVADQLGEHVVERKSDSADAIAELAQRECPDAILGTAAIGAFFLREKLKDCGSRIGACCDTGHYLRSGLDPVESVRKFGNRIFSFHIKDLDENHRDVPLGKGICKIAEILKVAAEHRVRAVFSVEYESRWENNMPQIAEGIRFFHETTRKIGLNGEQDFRSKKTSPKRAATCDRSPPLQRPIKKGNKRRLVR